MRLSLCVATVLLLGSAATASAEVTGTVTAVSDYDFRGITQTSQDPAIQGSIDYAHDSGFYAGAWASNVDFDTDGDVEVDLYAGFSGGETYPWDVGIVWYTYPGSDDLYDFPEVYASLGWKWFEGKIWYSSDFGGGPGGDNAFYYEANGTYELPAGFGLGAHIGYSDGDFWDDNYGGSYFDWSVGVTYTLSHFDFGLKWVDGSDLEALDGTPNDVSSSEARAIFSVSTTFPWSKE